MIEKEIVGKVLEVFLKEYQSVWLIDINDNSIKLYWPTEGRLYEEFADMMKVIDELSDYDKVRQWYADNYIGERYRKRLLEQSSLSTIISRTADGESFLIGYGRVIDNHKNYNQLVYDRINDENGELRCILLATRDIDIMRTADVDPLTGLLTRAAFLRHATDLVKYHPDKQFDVVISDIVDFKKINEVYGIQTADRILAWVGSYLAPFANDNLIIGRYGGDQMVMIGDHENIMKFTLSEESAKNWYYAMNRNGLPNIISKFGVYEDIPHDVDVISCCDKAHIALNNIKHDYSVDMAFYDAEMEQKLSVRRKIEDSMYSALQNEDFKVYYQPKHDAATGRLIGAEALVRWENSEFGFMSPSDFIPLFEMNGFVAEIDTYVWKRTCENIRYWLDKGLKVVPVSVNASKLTFALNDLVERYQRIAEEFDVSPDYLHIEITETLMSSDLENLIEKLEKFRSLGYEIELDDFGTGYSSLNILSSLPIDVVKLDMSFMKQFGNEKRTKVLAACIDLARELGYKTVSEGVEKKEQSDMLCKLGVDAIQGYLYSRPLSEEDFEDYLKENTMLI
ncbi:MAG: EAL domain-containing protein [Oscillospiraceae bacterium]|nr:EAL domain-containing protein [Oscillospiraceae bacterium]